MDVNVKLDTKGMNCPSPILKTKTALKEMSAGQILEVVTTDPGSKADFGAFCRTTGNDLLDSSEGDGIFTYLIKKS